MNGAVSAFGGASAILVKEVRGRMRGPRAFVFLTFFLTVLGGLLWAYIRTMEAQAQFIGFGDGVPGVEVGRGIFAGALAILTLFVVALAPAYTTGSISAEREKQTLDLLVVTPITSGAIVVGKLMSGLSYLFMLLAASLPIMTFVFVFGGVGFEDVVKGYIVLAATAIGLGSLGVFYSGLMRRTQAATMASYFTVIALTIGSLFVASLWSVRMDGDGGLEQPPEALLYLNPAIAQADVVCELTGDGCSMFGTRTMIADVGPGGELVQIEEPAATESFWPKSVIAWLAVSGVLLFAAAQLISPTRRTRPFKQPVGAAPVTWSAPEADS